MDVGLYCQFLHKNNPYLKLGPMKYEMLNREPEINLLHNFISNEEIRNVKASVKGKLITTPYLLSDKVTGVPKEVKFSKLRISKIKYLNELLDDNMRKISRKIEMATNFILFQNKFDSENYQVMDLI